MFLFYVKNALVVQQLHQFQIDKIKYINKMYIIIINK